jgi:hypothetical protein
MLCNRCAHIFATMPQIQTGLDAKALSLSLFFFLKVKLFKLPINCIIKLYKPVQLPPELIARANVLLHPSFDLAGHAQCAVTQLAVGQCQRRPRLDQNQERSRTHQNSTMAIPAHIHQGAPPRSVLRPSVNGAALPVAAERFAATRSIHHVRTVAKLESSAYFPGQEGQKGKLGNHKMPSSWRA